MQDSTPPVVENFDGGQSVLTHLTPNSNSVATPSGDTNCATQVLFQYRSAITYWAPMVFPAILAQDTGNSVVTFMKGLTVVCVPVGQVYQLLLTGKIKDTGTIYDFKCKSIGTFPSSSS